MRLILASASPRRRQLLTEAGYSIEVDPSGVEELEPEGPVDAAAYVAELAWRKAHAVALRRGSGLILAADTTCTLDGNLLNKPVDRQDAERMIRAQEGREVAILTGLCLYRAERHEWVGAVETSVVHVRAMTDDERIAHLDSGQWEGKAGAYGVQDNDPIVSVTSGSWSNVVGLPLERLEQLICQYPSIGNHH
ncbi:Maf family protein [Tautonia rosea]|uniref:Maf family protein n=1 Tax=Tautonia rosea TaxID=2728037 RepID=UPI0014729887|nr:Maf family protein [Tautonia rosea]